MRTTPLEGDITPVPPPWKLKAQVWNIPFITSRSQAASIPDTLMYSPLERRPYSNKEEAGEFVGGLGMIHLIRYSATPVGPYDELILTPGFWEWTEETTDKNGNPCKKKRKNTRVTRIYVSQKYTCWNGRVNWNIPKHLAKFTWTDNPDGSQTVQVFPHDLHPDTDPNESIPSEVPFFTATLKTIPWVPRFPILSSAASWVGLDISLVQPPLPEGQGSEGELPGTEEWVKTMAVEKTWRAHAIWCDLKQDVPHDHDVPGMKGRTENFIPGLSRWCLGVRMDDTAIDFGMGERWKCKLA